MFEHRRLDAARSETDNCGRNRERRRDGEAEAEARAWSLHGDGAGDREHGRRLQGENEAMSVLESRNNLSDRKTKAAPRLYVGSEVGTLRRVLLHRPGLELKRLTPANKDQLLFDDVLWVKRARQEHDAFADALAEAGVEVLYLQELLAHVLTDADVRTDFIEDTFQAARVRPHLSEPAKEWLNDLTPVRSTVTTLCSSTPSTRFGPMASRCRPHSRAATSL
jgi:hypothetical protein